jgi:hypothetical protein
LDGRGLISSKGKIFLISIALGPIQPPSRWVPGAPSLELKQQGNEADHALPFSAEVKNDAAIPPLPHMSSWHNAELIKYRDNFTFFTFITYYVTFDHI